MLERANSSKSSLRVFGSVQALYLISLKVNIENLSKKILAGNSVIHSKKESFNFFISLESLLK